MPKNIEIELSSAVLRPWKKGDEKSLVTHANNRKVSINLRDGFPYPYSAKDAQEWIKSASKIRPLTMFAIVVNDQAAGGIGIHLRNDVEQRSSEIGYWLGEAYWGQGIATEALKAVSEYAFKNFDLCRLYAPVFAWNPASARVLEKAGYKLEGRLKKSITKDGKTIDSFLYALVR